MTSEEFPDVGQRLCAVRLKRGFSQGMLAQRIGISTSYLSRIENGKIQPTFRTVLRILRGLKVGLEELVATDEVRSRKGPCPVSTGGLCLLDLLHADAHDREADERYTPRQIKLIRRIASWSRRAPLDRIRAMEVLLDDLIRATRVD